MCLIQWLNNTASVDVYLHDSSLAPVLEMGDVIRTKAGVRLRRCCDRGSAGQRALSQDQHGHWAAANISQAEKLLLVLFWNLLFLVRVIQYHSLLIIVDVDFMSVMGRNLNI